MKLKKGIAPAQVLQQHKREVVLLFQNNQKATRVTFIMPHDVYNIAKKLIEELWEKDPRDTMSIHMWIVENIDCHYHYKEIENLDMNEESEDDSPFCIVVQMDW